MPADRSAQCRSWRQKQGRPGSRSLRISMTDCWMPGYWSPLRTGRHDRRHSPCRPAPLTCRGQCHPEPTAQTRAAQASRGAAAASSAADEDPKARNPPALPELRSPTAFVSHQCKGNTNSSHPRNGHQNSGSTPIAQTLGAARKTAKISVTKYVWVDLQMRPTRDKFVYPVAFRPQPADGRKCCRSRYLAGTAVRYRSAHACALTRATATAVPDRLR